MTVKEQFSKHLEEFAATLSSYASTEDVQWTVRGFIDVFQNVYTISSDTKIVSKILEIHLFPRILEFARQHGYIIVLADHQNYYPDISFVKSDDESVRFAVDFKSTYRIPGKPHLCNGFTLGSHGEYFINRTSKRIFNSPTAPTLAIFVSESSMTVSMEPPSMKQPYSQSMRCTPSLPLSGIFNFSQSKNGASPAIKAAVATQQTSAALKTSVTSWPDAACFLNWESPGLTTTG